MLEQEEKNTNRYMKELNQYILEKFKITNNSATSTKKKVDEEKYYILPWGADGFLSKKSDKYLVAKNQLGYADLFLLNTGELYNEFLEYNKDIHKDSFCIELPEKYYKDIPKYKKLAKEKNYFDFTKIINILDNRKLIKDILEEYEKSI